MEADDMILVSVDDHVIEPPTMFDAHIPDKWRDQAPSVKEDADGSQYWEFEGTRAPNMGLNAVAGCPPEEYGLNPLRYDQMRPGCYDIHERIRDMNANGVLGSINFPTFVHFCGQLFLRASDKELALAVRARLQRLAHRRVGGHVPRAHHPDVAHAVVGREPGGRRDPPHGGQGLPRRHVQREPREARPPRAPPRLLGPVLPGLSGHRHGGVHAHRFVVVDDGHLDGRTGRREHRHHADELVPRPERPDVDADLPQVPRAS